MKTWIAAGALLALGIGARAQECVEYEDYLRLHGAVQTWGSARSLLLNGDLLYVASREWGLHVIDVSDRGAPVQLSQLTLDGLVWDMVRSGDHLYLATGSGGLQVVDVSDPLEPERVGGWNAWSWTTDVMVVGNVLIVADFGEGLFFFDLSDPEQPVPFWWQPTAGYALGLGLYENVFNGWRVACVASGEAGLQLVNFVDLDLDDPWSVEPGDIVDLGTLDTPGYARDVKVRNGRAWVCDGPGGLQIVDLADPEDPLVVGSAPSADYASRVVFEGNTAFLADGAAGLRIYDVSAPTAPVFVSSLDAPGWTYDVARLGDWVYLANGDNGLRIVDAAELAAPPRLGTLDLLQDAADLALVGTTAYVAAGGLQVVDFADPAAPVLRHEVPTGDEVLSVVASGGLVCTGSRSGAFRVYDAGGPGAPELVGEALVGSPLHDLAATAGHVLAAADTLGLVAISLADPAQPGMVLRVDTDGVASGLSLQTIFGGAQVLALADGRGGVSLHAIVDGLPSEAVGASDPAGDFLAVALDWPFLYAGDAERAVRTFNVEILEDPRPVHRCATTGPVHGLLVDGDLLVVAQDSSGIQVHGVDVPYTPYYLGSIDTDGRTRALGSTGEAWIAADGTGGVFAFLPQCQSSAAAGDGAVRPPDFALEPAAPNPFNPSTLVAWTQARPGRARLAVRNLLGQEVAVLLDGPVAAGRHESRFDGTGLASGRYFVVLDFDGARAARPVTLVK